MPIIYHIHTLLEKSVLCGFFAQVRVPNFLKWVLLGILFDSETLKGSRYVSTTEEFHYLRRFKHEFFEQLRVLSQGNT